MDYQNYQNYSTQDSMSLDTRVSYVMRKVYLKMFLALLVSAGVALGIAESQTLAQAVLGSTTVYWVLAIIEIGLVIAISAAINKISSGVATLLFYLFAVVNGGVLAFILNLFLLYNPFALVKTFAITAGTFGAMSIYGYMTRRDLTKFGTYMMFALFGLLITMLVNIFLKSSSLDWIISIVGVILFLGLTAWDTQKIKQSAMIAPSESISKLATIGALSLYLDFINLFLFLLRIFGGNRN